MTKVLVVGDANVDLVIPLDQSLSSPQLFGGGSAANTAVALARLGVPVAFAGTIGDDGYGRWACEDLHREQVDIHGLHRIPNAFTLMALAIIQPGGERQIIVWPKQGGAHVYYRPEDVDPAQVSQSAWLHTSGINLRQPPLSEAVLHSMRLARQAGIPVSLDLNLRIECFGMTSQERERFWEAVRLSDFVFGSAAEEILPLVGSGSAETAAGALSEGRRTIVLRLGEQGAVAVTPAGSQAAPAYPVQVVDTLGAGDAFSGGFIAARLAGYDLAQCLRWGNATAALKIGQAGARGLPTRAEVERLVGS